MIASLSGVHLVCCPEGHMSDPDELPGLAHFCEHMSFLGTEKVEGRDRVTASVLFVYGYIIYNFYKGALTRVSSCCSSAVMHVLLHM